MKPAPGQYHFHHGPGMAMDAKVDDTGMDTPFGRLTYYPPPDDLYRRDGVVPVFAVRFVDDTRYEAVCGGSGYEGTYWRMP